MTMLQKIENSILEIRGVPVILDGDVAALYEVETKHVNQAVRNNPDKFPPGYILPLTSEEWDNLRSKFLTLSCDGEENRGKEILRSKILILSGEWGKHAKYIPKAFTEQGLYMLATILKSSKATQTTLAIIETFTKIRRLGRSVKALASATSDGEKKQLMQQAGEIITDIFADDLEPHESETTVELNFALLKFKHTVKRNRKKKTGK
jgi:hypothetical protein